MATPQSIRYLNELRALNVLFRKGAMSRAALARELGLNRSSMGNIIANLVSDQMVVERADLERTETRTGRPGIAVELSPGGGAFIGAEIGVDRLGVVAIDLSTKLLYRDSVSFPTAERPADESIDAVIGMIREAIAKSGGPGEVRGLCVTLPALLDRKGLVINGLLLGWQQVPLRTLLQGKFGEDFPIIIENDANAFGIAETYKEPSNRSDTKAFLMIENGVGGGIVVGGKLFRGSYGHAAEFGQIVLGGEGFFRGRTRPGHLEGYVGKDAILARYHWHGADPQSTLDDLLAAIGRSESIALKTAHDWGQKLALGLTQITSVLNPSAIVLGGSVAPVFDVVADDILGAMRKEFIEGFRMPEIRVSALGIDGPSLGGAMLMHQQMFSVDEKVLHHGEQSASASA
ncbi:ROK family transcriptional regulator [Devosia submarina]|uniref:ROK family transcriptional regulator n=1 Tax=Devosia submarina TaxID=1173082 RepID=UPI000D3A8619|nr:ROK family transcriptional regulator [Devosia submarina]